MSTPPDSLQVAEPDGEALGLRLGYNLLGLALPPLASFLGVSGGVL